MNWAAGHEPLAYTQVEELRQDELRRVYVEAANACNVDLLLEPPVPSGIADVIRRMGTSI